MGYLRAGMIDLLKLLGGFLVGLFRSQAAREAEMAFLRQQLLVLKRSAPARLRLRNADRLIFVWLYRLFPSLLGAAVIFQPETLVRWHRSSFRLFLALEVSPSCRPACGARRDPRSDPNIEPRQPALGRTTHSRRADETWYRHCTVDGRQVHVRRRHRPSPGWRAFLRNHTDHIAAVDLFVVPTIGFKLLYGLVILRLERRRLVWTNVTTNPTAEWIARQITEAFPWDEAPRYLLRDRDTSYGAAVTRRLRTMGIRDRPITPRSPWQNGHVERLIGSIRRQYLDNYDAAGLERTAERHVRAVDPGIGEFVRRNFGRDQHVRWTIDSKWHVGTGPFLLAASRTFASRRSKARSTVRSSGLPRGPSTSFTSAAVIVSSFSVPTAWLTCQSGPSCSNGPTSLSDASKSPDAPAICKIAVAVGATSSS